MPISLDNIKRGTKALPPRIVIYGVGGIGKTTFAAMAPSPIFICTEDGLGKLDAPHFTSESGSPVLRTWSEVIDALTSLLTSEHSYKTAVIDSLDCLEPLIWQRVCDTVPTDKGARATNIEDYGFFKGQRTHVPKVMRHLLAGLDALRAKGIGVILIGHSKIKRFEPPDAEAYERYQIKLDDAAAGIVYDWADCVLFAQQKVHVKTDGKGFDERKRAVGTGERILYTEERPAWQAKNRYSLPTEIPLSWAAFSAAYAAAVPTWGPNVPALTNQPSTSILTNSETTNPTES